ncbi:MAG: RHS repeat protein, partial [Chlamydiia bacterium]|nr:RHS repeat protein [Chlamydiia bacterium]
MSYDRANRQVRIADWHSDGTILIHETEYDKLGQVIAETDVCGNTTRFTYDALGRRTELHHPDGVIERQEYDALGNITKFVDGKGYETRALYDFRGNPLAIFYSDGTEEHFTYTPQGLLATHSDQNGATSLFTYDVFDHPVHVKVYSASRQLLKETSALYSPFHKLSETNGERVTLFYSYDYAGKKVSEQVGPKKITYSYDSLGHLICTDYGTFQEIQNYDLKEQLLSKETRALDTLQFQERYAYDEEGNRSERITSHGSFITLYNPQKQPVLEKNPLGFETTYSYLYGKEYGTLSIDPNQIQTHALYDNRGRARECFKKNAQGETLSRYTNLYDSNGNL